MQKMFREYYARDFSLSTGLSLIEKREFGFAPFEGGMHRHKSFKNEDELIACMRDFTPKDAYLSCAYYESPAAEMEKKGWLGADLIFDIDSDHLPSHCDKVHDTWTCGICGFIGNGTEPKECPNCSSGKFEVSKWPCETCLDSAKTETRKLLDILVRDFGFSEKEMQIFFSGHRGYHVHVALDDIMTLDSVARREIVDYIYALGLDYVSHGMDENAWNAPYDEKKRHTKNFGWSGRIARSVQDFVLEAKQEDYAKIGLGNSVINTIINNRGEILEEWNDVGFQSTVKGISFQTWKKIAEFCVDFQSAKIDTVVTTDIHRLIRMPSTLHGKTGLIKNRILISDLKDFDPFGNAVAFKKGTANVFVSNSPEFRLGDGTFGPYENEKVELPTAAAILLICKGRAEVVE